MMGNILVTKQTGPEGKKVNRIFIEEGCKIDREFYFGLLIDRKTSELTMMISSAGGIDIEDVAEKNPEKIHTIHFNDFDKISIPDKLKEDLRQHVAHEMGPIAKPEQIDFVDSLPKTRSGKIMRRVLKARALGIDPGNLSTLEE